jgi:hypothetical protein
VLRTRVVVDVGEAAPEEDLEAEVAASFGPFVVLLGEDGADQPDRGEAVGEDADDVGAAPDLAVEPLVRVVRPDLTPQLLRVGGEGEDVGPGLVEVRGDWTVELGLAHHPDDDVGTLRLLRPVRAIPEQGARLLILEEDNTPGVFNTVRTASVRLGLGAAQVQSATSVVTALADVIAGEARLLCGQMQAHSWSLGWQPASELGVRRHYRLGTARPEVASVLSPMLEEPIGRALGTQRSR